MAAKRVYRKDEYFERAAASLPMRFKEALIRINAFSETPVSEIRLRVGRPMQLKSIAGSVFCDVTGAVSAGTEGLLKLSREEMEECFRTMCGYSVHTHQNEIINGYITLKGGSRAGICGTAVWNKGEISGVRDISSINLRISREAAGCADELAQLVEKSSGGVLLGGAPHTGKTTMIRELARKLSSAENGAPHTVAVIDERSEIAAMYMGSAQNNIGICCDVLDGYPKAAGMLMAIRTLSPEIIIADEIGGDDEADAVISALNAGVKVIATAHAGNMGELLARRQTAKLISAGAFEYAVVLESGKLGQIAEVRQLKNGSCSRDRRWIEMP
ncbi:MAG: Flp pilus assembly complex ATPase component TadA [Oscillospiraceae bacterium]|nr:Flp pilus assembly complex ATPase component TadA [Oscillospiraceae bacterium]